jgi:hypothetical protein
MSIVDTIITDGNPKERVRDGLKSLLKTLILEVRFTKADGTERDMVCTLNPEVLPEETETKTTTTKRKLSDEVIRVYDIENEAWRSFRVDSLIDVHLA